MMSLGNLPLECTGFGGLIPVILKYPNVGSRGLKKYEIIFAIIDAKPTRVKDIQHWIILPDPDMGVNCDRADRGKLCSCQLSGHPAR